MNTRDPLAAALSSLAPASAAIDRDRLYFEAGRATGARSVRRWRFATGTVAAASVAIAMLGTMQPTRKIETKTLELTLPVTPLAPIVVVEDMTPSEDAIRWLKLRNQVVALGVDELPAANTGGSSVVPHAGMRVLD